MSEQVNTQLVSKALDLTVGRRQPASGLLHHSDRGSQYAKWTTIASLNFSGFLLVMSSLLMLLTIGA